MAISLIHSDAKGRLESDTFSLPTLQEGDMVMVLGISCYNPATDTDEPTTSGYTTVYNGEYDSATNVCLSIFYKFMGSTPDTSVDFADSGMTAILAVFRGVDDTDPIDVSPVFDTGSSGMPDSPSITVATDDSCVIALAGLDFDRVGGAVTAPSGYTMIESQDTGGGTTSYGTIMAAYKTAVSSGTENPGAFSGSGSDLWTALTFALTSLITASEGGSEVDVDITADGGTGEKIGAGGSEADTDITADGGAGEKIAYSASSYGSVGVTAEGGGRGIVMYQFISDPTVKLQQPVATHVKVVSPDYTTGYTAVISPAPSADKAKYRFVEIPEGDSTVCQQVAESLLAKWSVERKNVVGQISLNFALKFEEYVYVSIPQAGIDEELIIQKLVHNISNMTTTMTLGDDVLLNDDELIARIIDELS